MNIQNLLEKQAMLDSNINNTRERTIEDIRMSMIAEIIEFNEELECSHKTWKHKEVDKGKQLTEWVDIFFFVLQGINLTIEEPITLEIAASIIQKKIWECEKLFEKVKLSKNNYDSALFNFIGFITSCKTIVDIFVEYLKITIALGYTLDEIQIEYNRKWEVNMQRIGAEWR